MDVAVDGHGRLDLSRLHQDPDRDGNIIQEAESFAMVGEGMMKSAAERNADAVRQGATTRFDRPARSQPKSIDQLL